MAQMDAEQYPPTFLPNRKISEEFIQLLRETLIKDLERSNAIPTTGYNRTKTDRFNDLRRLSGDRRNNGASVGRTLPVQWLGSSLKTVKEFEHLSGSQRENEFLSSTKSDGALAEGMQIRKKKSRLKKFTTMIGHLLHRNEKKRRKKRDTGDDTLAVNGPSRKGSETFSVSRLKSSERRDSNDSRKRETKSIFRSFLRSRSHKRDSDAKPASEAEGFHENVSIPATTQSPKDIVSDHFNTLQSVRWEASDAHLGTYSISTSTRPGDAKLDNDSHIDSSASMILQASHLTSTTSRPITRNALDDPGDEIDYMDLDTPDGASLDSFARRTYSFSQRKMSMSKFLDSEGIKQLQLLAQAQMETESKSEGDLSSNDEVKPGASCEASTEDEMTVSYTHKSLDELYDMCAKMLAEIADSSKVSDCLKEFKEDIIARSRTTGEPILEAVDSLKTLVMTEMHLKCETQGSLSSDLAFYPMKLAYFTTRAAVSFVGLGTETATRMIEYIGDMTNIVISSGEFDVD